MVNGRVSGEKTTTNSKEKVGMVDWVSGGNERTYQIKRGRFRGEEKNKHSLSWLLPVLPAHNLVLLKKKHLLCNLVIKEHSV